MVLEVQEPGVGICLAPRCVARHQDLEASLTVIHLRLLWMEGQGRKQPSCQCGHARLSGQLQPKEPEVSGL